MKYLKEFLTHAEYEAYTADTTNFMLPNVSICIQEDDVHYNPEIINVTSVILNKSSLSLNQGESETLVATVLPNDATNKEVLWSSSDSSVATVDSNGKVTAINEGDSTITVTTVDGGFTAQCAISVIVPHECASEIVETTYEMVDLGLPSGVKWANKNIGAELITDYGQKFSWGGISGYTHDQISGDCHSKAYEWPDYELGNGTSSPSVADMTKYNNTDYLSTLELSDDAAHVNMGGSWRMPTLSNFTELLDTSNCTKEWVTNYEGSGINGYLFTSVRNSNTLFFPAAGICTHGSIIVAGDEGRYWSSEIYSGNRKFAFALYFNYNYGGEINCSDYGRYYGHAVRGVID